MTSTLVALIARGGRDPLTVGAAALLLTACGGGGGDAPAPPPSPSVSSVVVGTAKYSQTVPITVNGTNLDQGLSVSLATPAACKNLTHVGTASPTAAQYQCTASGVGVNQVVVTPVGGGAVLGTGNFTVPAPQVTLTVSNSPGVVSGNIVVTLDPTKTPITVDNFLAYVNANFYAGLIFHRVVANFVIQGGGYTPIIGGVVPAPKPTNAPIVLEVGKGLSNLKWTIAMARAAGADTATSQFFINLQDNLGLDPSATSAGYAVFGAVTTGTDVVTAIVGAPCAPIGGFSECAPNPNMVISAAVQTQ